MAGKCGPVAALVLAAVLWGLATTATKFALRGFAPMTVLAVELVAGTAGLWIVLLIQGYRAPPSWPVAVTLGLLEPALANIGETVGLARTSACNAALIFGLESTFVIVLAAVFLREPVTRALGAAALMALLGLVALESGSGITAPRVGDLFVLGGAVGAAGYTIVARQADVADDSLGLTAHQFLFAALLVVPITVSGWASGASAAPTHVAARYWLTAVLVGLAGSAVAFILYNYAISRMPAGPAGIVINLIPAFAMVSAVGWLHETITLPRAGGALLVASSVAMFSWTELRARPAECLVGAPVGRAPTDRRLGATPTAIPIPIPGADSRDVFERRFSGYSDPAL